MGTSIESGIRSDGFPASHWLESLKTTETADERWKRAVAALAGMGLRAVPALIDATGNEHPEVRRGASSALHQIGPAIIPFLMKALRHEKPLVREAAARGLYGFAPQAQQAIPALTDALNDSDAFVRQWVATALQNLAHYFGPVVKIAAPGLTDLLKDEDFMVREWSAHALGSIGRAVLVEAEGRRLFYTGDFRAHGRKASLTEKLIANPPRNVDILLMEGTCVGREDKTFHTEDDLVPHFVEHFRRTPGMSLVWCSGQNLDRIVTIWKACRKADRQFIIDMYTAEMLRATGNDRMPQTDWDRIRVFLPSTQRWRIKNEGAFHVSDSYKPYRIHWNQLAGAASKSVMLFRPSMVRDLERAGCLKDACVICSEWAGYLEKENNRWFVEWMKRNGIANRPCHTSGHASIPDLRRMRAAFHDSVVVPVHLEDRDRFVDLFDNVELHDDREWWGI